MTEKVFLLMFDARMLTAADRRNYRAFLSSLKREGFTMLQKSVYIRMYGGSRGLAAENARVARFTPRSVAVRLLELSVGNFDAMTNLNCDACPFVPLDEVICI